VDSSQTMAYNGLQTSLRRRFSNRYSWDVNYTLGKSDSTQGGDLSVYYITSYNAIQDFWDPDYDYGPPRTTSVIGSTPRSSTSFPRSVQKAASRMECWAAGRFQASFRRDRAVRWSSRNHQE
jgi:hypothetical protein